MWFLLVGGGEERVIAIRRFCENYGARARYFWFEKNRLERWELYFRLEEKDKGKIRSGNIFIRCKRIVCINLVFAVINFDEKFCITWKKESHAHRMEYTYNYNKIQPTVNKSMMASSHPLITRKYTQFT